MKLVKKLKICLVLLLILSFTTSAIANPGKYVQLEKGQTIPWSGWCFDEQATAHIVAEKDSHIARCRLNLERQAEELEASHNLEIGKLKAELQYEVQTRDVAIRSLQEENLKIENALIHEHKFGWVAPASIGALVGALTIFLVTL